MNTLLNILVGRGGGNTETIPRTSGGGLHWLEKEPGGFIQNVQLDIVGFLAILGEGSIAANLQVSTLSKLIFIPRLIPAPQVFFRPTRDSKLDPSPGNVTGIYSGNDKDFINYLGHVVLDAEDMPDYSVRCIEIEKTDKKAKVKAKTKGPLAILSLLGAGESIAILGTAIYNEDGFATLAVLLLSLLSSLAGLANWWYLELPKRRKVVGKPNVKNPGAPAIKMDPPPGDVVVRYPKGSFLVVQCSEDVARELYFAPENVYYLVESPWMYRLMSLCGTLMLMIGIVALGNAQPLQQIIFAGCYMALNAAYWLVAALPPRFHWDLSMYKVKKQRLVSHYGHKEEDDEDDDKDALLMPKSPKELKRLARYRKERAKIEARAAETYTDLNHNFTWAMWKTIVATNSVDWVKKNDALPETPVWHEWLRDALKEAGKRSVYYSSPTEDPTSPNHNVKTFEVPDWDPQARFYELLNKHQGDDTQKLKVTRNEQIVPGPPSKRTTQASGFEKESYNHTSAIETPMEEAVSQNADIGDIGIPTSTSRQPVS